MSKELAELLTDVKEQVKYLSELGVESLKVELPERIATPKPISRQTTNEIPRERLEKFVPADEIIKTVTDSKSKEPRRTAKPKRRSGLLDSAKLSNRKPTNKIDRTKTDFVAKTAKADQNMPKKENLKETLFGDFSDSLPDSNETLEDIRGEIGKDCKRCKLCEDRTQVVNSVGNPQADIMIIGEAPGADEDEKGEPFVGRAGKLLTKIIEGINLKREDVFIGNINRCRPPSNRQPTAEESAECKPFLLREIATVKPKVIIVLGNTACQNLLETKVGITKLRGKFQNYHGVKVMPTFHPAYLLRDPRKKREVWEDMKMVRDEIAKSFQE